LKLWQKRIVGFFGLTLFVGILFVVGNCSKGGSSSTNSFPAIAPIVAKALPASLAPSSTSVESAGYSQVQKIQKKLGRLRTITPSNDPPSEMANAAAYIQSLFQNSYNNSDNGQASQGLLNMLVITIDGRMAGINTQIGSSTPSCMSNTATPYTIDLTNIDPMLKFTLNDLQCSSAFNNNAGGGGILFGSNGTNYSMQMSLGPMGTATGTFYTLGGFFAAANVNNYGSSDPANPESVDGMLIAYQPGTSQSPQMWVTRFKATPTTNTFELFFAANEPDIQGANRGATNELGGGFRMISDGVHIYSDGVLLDQATPPGTYYNYNTCITASTMAYDPTASDCDALANSFTIAQSASLNFAEVTGFPNAVVPPGPGSTTGNCTAIDTSSTQFNSSDACIVHDGPLAPVAQSSVFSSLNTFFPVANANLPSF
jgi:hypothetical protein